MELLNIKYDFTVFEALDQRNTIVIDQRWMEEKIKEILERSYKNMYSLEEDIKLNRVLNLDNRFKKIEPKVDDELTRQIINVVAYNVSKFGTLKFGPILCLNATITPSTWIDLSPYVQDGHKNDVASAFAVKTSELIDTNLVRTNFQNFCDVRNVVFQKDHRIYQFPRAFLLLKGIERAKCRRDLNNLFNYLMNPSAVAFTPEFLKITFLVEVKTK